MSTIALLARRGLRRHWVGWALVSLLTALTLTVGGGAVGVGRQTLTAHGRVLDSIDAPDLTLGMGNPDEPGQSASISPGDLLALDGVADIAVVRSTLGAEVDAQGRLVPTGSTGLTAAVEGSPAVPLLRGRMPADDASDEVAISAGAVEVLGADLGERIRYAVVTFPELAAITATGAQRGGTTVEPVVVGVFGPTALDGPVESPTSASSIIASRAFLAEHPGVGTYQLASIRLQDDTTVASFLHELEARFGPGLDITTRAQIESTGRRAVRPEAFAVVGFALAAGLAGVIITAQTIARQLSDERDERTLLALGLDRPLRAAQRWAQGVVAIAVGAVLGLVGSGVVAAASGPIGIAGAFDRPGLEGSDLATAWGTGAILLLALVGLTAISAWRGSRVAPQLPASTPGWTASLLSAAPVALRTGAALSGRGTSARRAVRGAVIGVATSAVVIVAVITFASSLNALVSTPALYGQDYDLAVWDGYGAREDDVITDVLSRDPRVDGISRAAGTSGTINGREAGLVGFDDLAIGPHLTSGTYPATDDEVLLGRRLARRLGVAIGAEVSVVVGEARQTYRVVGLGVTPDNVGDGAAFTLAGIERAAPDAEVGFQYVRLQRGSAVEPVIRDASEVLGCQGDCDVLLPAPPTDLTYLDRVGDLPRWSVGTVILLGVAMAIHALLIVGRRSRRSIAVLRSVGASRPQVTRYLLGQAVLIVVTATALGVVAGLVIGRAVWGLFADELGVVSQAASNPGVVAASLGLLVVITVAAAVVPARRTARQPIVPELRAD